MSEAAEELRLLEDTQVGLVSQTNQEQRVSQSENLEQVEISWIWKL